MQIRVTSRSEPFQHATQRLIERMVDPLCGITQELNFIAREQGDDKVITAGAKLTGVHVILGKENPGPGAYHIGGAGLRQDEVMIKALAESVERYAQLMVEKSRHIHIEYGDYQRMLSLHLPVLSVEKFRFFSENQLKRPGFPFKAFGEHACLGWVEMASLLNENPIWVPAQLNMVGYQPKCELQEPWIYPAVTTGTAAHVDPSQALLNALLELIQIDSAVGHWYTKSPAFEILLDKRVGILNDLMVKNRCNSRNDNRFYWLPNPDLPGFSVAYLNGCYGLELPRVSIGLGSDMSLIRAMYKAYLEGVASKNLARMEMFKFQYESMNQVGFNRDTLFDLDTNVVYYGYGKNADRIKDRFLNSRSIFAGELPKDWQGDADSLSQSIVGAFKSTHKELLVKDLTLCEIADLGFYVKRVWSPDTLSLPLPSAVPKCHARFSDYGGLCHDDPHPYP